jgi:thiol:disulfide interchange protein
MRKDKALTRKVLTWAAIAAALYFGNVQLQTWLGHRALARTGLEVHTLEEGLRIADASDKLVLANVTAIWCSSCRTFDGKVLSDDGVKEVIDSRYVFVRIEYESDEGKAFRERYDVSGFPRLVVLDAEGTLVAQLPTVYDPNVFRLSLAGV